MLLWLLSLSLPHSMLLRIICIMIFKKTTRDANVLHVWARNTNILRASALEPLINLSWQSQAETWSPANAETIESEGCNCKDEKKPQFCTPWQSRLTACANPTQTLVQTHACTHTHSHTEPRLKPNTTQLSVTSQLFNYPSRIIYSHAQLIQETLFVTEKKQKNFLAPFPKIVWWHC